MSDDTLSKNDMVEEVDENEEETDGLTEDTLPPPNLSEEDDEEVEDDDSILADGFSPVEGEEAGFDPENPDDYLYTKPQIKYSDSAEENEADWVDDNEDM